MNKHLKALTAEEYLKRPYARVLIPDEDAGGFTAFIKEFPGCIAEGDSADEALGRLDNTALGWIEAALYLGQTIPEPHTEHRFSGKLAVRMSPSLHQRVAEVAADEGVSINQMIVTILAERVGAAKTFAFTQQWISHGLTELLNPICESIQLAADHAASAYTSGAHAIFDKTIETFNMLKSRVSFDTPEPARLVYRYETANELAGKMSFAQNRHLAAAPADKPTDVAA